MKIYFPEIAFQNNPLVWEFNETTGCATCLFYCLNETSKSIIAKTYITDLLEKIPGIKIIDGVPIIPDAHLFDKKYTPVEIEPSFSIKPMPLKKNNSFFKSRTTSHVRLTSLPPTYEHIDLDSIIPYDPVNANVWGETVAFEKHFLEKNSKDAKTHPASFLKSAMTFNAQVQYEKNEQINPIKYQLITSIRALLDLLDPIYVAWRHKSDALSANTNEKKLLFAYLQNAVLDVMLNGKFNQKPTEFESMESSKVSSTLLKYAEHQARALRAELMLMKFLVLVKEDLSVELAVSDKEDEAFLHILHTLQKFISKQPIKARQEISTKLQEITPLIIQCGVVEAVNQKLHQKLKDDLEAKKFIYNCISFQSLLTRILTPSITKPELIPGIITQATLETIKKIEKCFSNPSVSSYVAPLSISRDQDFYLCMNWAEKLIPELSSIKLKHPKEEKKITTYCDDVAEAVIDFIYSQLKELTVINQAQPSSSTMSM
jgi:hypothetical protein